MRHDFLYLVTYKEIEEGKAITTDTFPIRSASNKETLNISAIKKFIRASIGKADAVINLQVAGPLSEDDFEGGGGKPDSPYIA